MKQIVQPFPNKLSDLNNYCEDILTEKENSVEEKRKLFENFGTPAPNLTPSDALHHPPKRSAAF